MRDESKTERMRKSNEKYRHFTFGKHANFMHQSREQQKTS